jgi:CSLREA domain-containing protein
MFIIDEEIKMTRSGFKLNSKALFGLMVLAAAGVMPVQAATIEVNTTTDVIDAEDGLCSLREAVIAANENARSGEVFGECAAGQSAVAVGDVPGVVDIIKVPVPLAPFTAYTLSLHGVDEEAYENLAVVPITPDAREGDLDITESVIIQGAGSGTTTIQWASQEQRDRIFHVNAEAGTVDVTIQGVTLKNGQTLETGPHTVTVDEQEIDFYLRRAGGAIAVGAAYRMVDPTVSGGDGSNGGGNPTPGDDESGATYSIKLDDVVVDGNEAGGDGGGIYTAAPLTATSVVVKNNEALTNGGGIYNEGLTTITNSTISGNIAEGGGGLFLTGTQPIDIVGTTLNANRAVGGGAISGRSGVTINIVNSTLSGNLARDIGAGFYHNGPANLNFVTIANNVTGTEAPAAGSGINTFQSGAAVVVVKNVLLAANVKGFVAIADSELYKTVDIPQPGDLEFPLPEYAANCGYSGNGLGVTSSGNNLSTDATCTTFIQASDIETFVDPAFIIGPLKDNDGPTQTHALLPGSPALSAGAWDANVTKDQRGDPRETPPDIGAFELDNIGGGGGGCAVGGEGRLDPTLPAMLAAALAFFGWRRRAGK